MHTAICAFDDHATAQQAVERLVHSGFDRQDIHIEHRQLRADETARLAGGAAGSGEQEAAGERGPLEAIGRFFTSLFGKDHPSGFSDTYSAHVEHGRAVVMVDVRDDMEAERAQSLLLEMSGGEMNVVHRPRQRPLRDLLSGGERPPLADRGRERGNSAVEAERALAASGLEAGRRSLDLRAEDELTHVGLRYADKDRRD